MAIRAGKLRKKIELQALTETVDDTGGVSDGYSIIAQRFASVEPLNGREFFDGQAYSANLSIRFRLRYDSSLSSIKVTDQVLYDSRTFNIIAIINTDEMNRELLLMCSELV